MNPSLISELRRLTNEALEEAQIERKAEEARKREEVARAQKAAIAKAEDILRTVPEQCRAVAREGLKSTVIVQLKHSDYEVQGGNYNEIKPIQLRGFSVYVFEGLTDMGLNPTLDYNHDGCGMDSWIEVTAHW